MRAASRASASRSTATHLQTMSCQHFIMSVLACQASVYVRYTSPAGARPRPAGWPAAPRTRPCVQRGALRPEDLLRPTCHHASSYVIIFIICHHVSFLSACHHVLSLCHHVLIILAACQKSVHGRRVCGDESRPAVWRATPRSRPCVQPRAPARVNR